MMSVPVSPIRSSDQRVSSGWRRTLGRRRHTITVVGLAVVALASMSGTAGVPVLRRATCVPGRCEVVDATRRVWCVLLSLGNADAAAVPDIDASAATASPTTVIV